MSLALLSAAEVAALDSAESEIRSGLSGFKQAGTALAAVRDQRLYRAEFATFEDYCAEKWGMGRQHAYQRIANAVVAQEMEAAGIAIVTESHASALAKVPQAERVQIFRQAESGGKVTAEKINDAIKAATHVEHETEIAKAKPITPDRFEKVVETEMARIDSLIESFPDPKHLLVIDENLKFLRGRIEELMTIPA